jgi:hypothetical protein
MKQTIPPKIRQTGLILAVITLTALLLTGCFWTPDEKEGGITLNISTGGMSSSAVGDFNGFFLGYVISDDLLRGDQAAAEQAFTEVDSAFETVFDQLSKSPIETGGSFDPTDYRVNVALPSIQMQAEFFTGTSGSNSFRGLQAGRDYLVVVESINFGEKRTTQGIGYAVVNIEAGKTRSVNLNLSFANYAKASQFLANRYGIDDTQNEIALTLLPKFPLLQVVPEFLYYDLIDADATPLDFGQYIVLNSGQLPGYYAYEDGQSPLSGALITDRTLLNADGSPVADPGQGNRPKIPDDLIIRDVKPGMRVQLVVTSLQERVVPTFPSPEAIGISEPFTTGFQPSPLMLDIYTWATGF